MCILPSIFICHFLLSIACGYVIEQGPTDLILNWNNSTRDKYVVDLKENNHIDGSDYLLLFTIKEVSAEPQFRPGPASFQYEMVPKGNSTYEFYITQFMDYETETSHTYLLTSVVDGTQAVTITIHIINYDDENPTLTAPMCTMEENTDYSDANTECTATLSDPDGWLSQTTFTIINSNPSAEKPLEREDEIFEFNFNQSISDTTYSTTVYLTTTMQLDYETKIFYSFVVQAKDGALHPTVPKEDVTCIVNVKDLNDMPPQWTDYFTTGEIDEEVSYRYEMTAVDGDKGINANITYHLVSYDEGICTDSCITITTENKKAIIKVNPIDRDAKDISTYKFKVMAIEDDEPPYNDNITITFFVNDIDDNSPLMINVSSINETTIDLVDEDPKIVDFTFYENFAGTINGHIFIQDIDTGENAQFTVALVEDESQERKANYTDAFLIVPTAGYRKGEFQITVKNAKYLDYEDEIWRDFTFYVQSTGNKNQTKQDNLLVQIDLVDYNDELPIFKNPSYTASVNETIKKGTQIIVVQATDRDAEDKILKHQLIGSNTITSLLNIESATGEISVAVEDAFDYDRINPVIFQVQAIDLVNHTTTVSVTINLLDVNNKAPTYKVAEVIRVDENQVIDIKLNATITASDVDTTRDLVAEINWDKSYAMKNSIKLDLTKPPLKQAVEFLKLDYDKISEDTIEITLLVNDNNDAETAPDYETFDTLYLDLNITDLNTEVPEFEKQKSIDALIVVYINDINDNAPIFTNETIAKKRSVLEKLTKGTIVGTIEAVDLDVGSVVEYACNLNKTFDWFECDKFGQITTKTSAIDADIGVFYVDLNCTATDGYWITWHVFSIDILDTNDQWPQIDVNATSPSAETVKVDEKSETGTLVTTIRYRDADRDKPFHTVNCTINETEECFGFFEIKINELYVLNGGDNLDRDTKKPNYTCTPTCYDNRLKEQDQGQNFNTTTSFLIILKDINDHWPELITKSVSASENLKQDDLIDKIIAEDLDEGKNSEIDMTILSVEKLDDKTEKDYSNLFRLYKNESDYYTDISTIKQWYLLANVDLRDNYGEYSIKLNLSDQGDPINSTTTLLPVQIQKFNYYPPVFVFPNASKLTFSLSSDQEPNKQLIMYYNNEIFEDIKITDSADEQCIDKWTPTFDIALMNASKTITNFFVLNKSAKNCTTQLQVNNLYDQAEAIDNIYQLRLTATLAQDVIKQENEASYVESIDIKLNFVDVNDEPEFNQTLGAWNINFLEATDDDPKQLPTNRQAFYPNVDDSDRIPKHYFLKSQNDSVTEAFEIDESTGNVSLKQQLDYLKASSYDFKMRVARNSSGVSSKDASSLEVIVTVIDINNHAPEFVQDSFFGAILQNTQNGATIVTLNATDLDEIDKDDLKYSINSDIVAYGNSIENAFLLNEDTGAITLNFQVDYNINGYFVFSVKVQDQQDQYGNGPFEDTSSVTIYIVTEEYILGFKFENTLDQVVGKKLPILKSISDSLGWDCHEQSIDKDSQSGYTYDNVTKANIYCVDGDTLVTSAKMKEKLNNINTFQLLKKALLESGILLQNFNTDTATEGNLESTLKTALISVSLVLGTLTLVLSVTFFLKARELKRRLNKLTRQEFGSDDSNMNRKGVNAPTTNMFTIEGSNPIFNHDTDDFIKADILSIHSGHSDLSGLEDNPEFDLHDTEKY
ncbi:unnamed protein product [Ceutorhynchus assimilis]|uniref:Cadherin domain-containing protein n=1 Tax=Ceutorhynchus assimilis TaxID=467358 RepID=A0A9P0DHW6_9CUCU|nr:unnamed protein product [Ceutorhynchus assimilis]